MIQFLPAVYLGVTVLFAVLGLLGAKKKRPPRLRVALLVAVVAGGATAALSLIHPLFGVVIATGVVLQLAIEGV